MGVEVRDEAGVAGPPVRPFALSREVVRDDLYVTIGGCREQLPVLEPYRRRLEDQLDFDRCVLGVTVGREVDAADAAWVLHRDGRRVLDLGDARVREVGGDAGDRLWRAEQPAQQVERVDGLVDEHTAARLAPGGAPRRGRVVRGVAMPPDRGTCGEDRAVRSVVDQQAQRLAGVVVAVLEADCLLYTSPSP